MDCGRNSRRHVPAEPLQRNGCIRHTLEKGCPLAGQSSGNPNQGLGIRTTDSARPIALFAGLRLTGWIATNTPKRAPRTRTMWVWRVEMMSPTLDHGTALLHLGHALEILVRECIPSVHVSMKMDIICIPSAFFATARHTIDRAQSWNHSQQFRFPPVLGRAPPRARPGIYQGPAPPAHAHAPPRQGPSPGRRARIGGQGHSDSGCAASASAWRTRSGRNGISRRRTPVAAWMALAMAAGTGHMAASPAPMTGYPSRRIRQT